MFPPNYDVRGAQMVHEQHLKELRAEAEAYRLAQEFKQARAANEAAKPSLMMRMVRAVVGRIQTLLSATRAKPRDAKASAGDEFTTATAKRP
jgi:hypothetical protein